MNKPDGKGPWRAKQVDRGTRSGRMKRVLVGLRPLGRWADLLTVLCLTCIVYFNSLSNGFVFFDRSTVFDNSAIRHLDDLGAVIRYLPSRPLFTLSLAANYAVGELNPLGYHFLNVCFHLAAVALVYVLVRMMIAGSENDGRLKLMPSTAAALFALHPLNSQTVNYVSARPTALATVFYLAGVALFAVWNRTDRSRRSRWMPLAGMYVCFALAMAGKEIAVTFPAAVLLYDYTFVARGDSRSLRGRWAVHLPLWLAGLASVAAFKWYSASLGFIPARSVWTNLTTQFEIVVRYLRLTAVPVGLNVHHTVPESAGMATVQTLTSLAAIGVLAAMAVALLHRHRAAGYGILWFLLALLPTSSVIPLAVLMNENRLYLPGVGFAVVSGYALTRLLPKNAASRHDALQSVGGIIVVLVGLVYGMGTLYRNTVWRDDYTLWSDSLRKGSYDYVTLTNLAQAYADRAMFYRALDMYREAADLDPTDRRAYAGMGKVHYDMGNLDEAAEQYRQAVNTGSVSAADYTSLSIALEKTGHTEESREATAKALELDPAHPGALVAAGRSLFANGNIEEARNMFDRAVYLRPEQAEYHDQLGIAYIALGDAAPGMAEKGECYGKALAEHKRAVQLEPTSARSHYNLANTCARLGPGRAQEAIAAYQTAIRLHPAWPNSYVNLGSTLMQTGQIEEAVRQFDRAIEIDPTLTRARYNRASAWIQLGKVDAAIIELRALLDRAPELAANIQMSIGEVYLAKRDTDRARQAFQAALDADPNFPQAQAALNILDVQQR